MRQVITFNNKNWPLPEPYVYPGLKFKSTGNSTISMIHGNYSPDMKYSLDGGQNWFQWDYSSISLNDRQIVCFKGNNSNGVSTGNTSISQFQMTGSLSASGNIMSLLDDGACTRLSVPNHCFHSLFSSCRSLTTAPELPATTLGSYCYNSMFLSCTSLTSAPELPATATQVSSYENMFYGCVKLNNIKTWLNSNALVGTKNWLKNVAATGDFYKLGSYAFPTDSASGIPTGWTVHTTL